MFKKIRQQNVPSSFDHEQISWIAPERIRYQRGKLWLTLSIVCVLAAAAWGFIYEAWTFSIAIIAFAIVYALTHMERPQDVKIVISDIGIKVGGRRYPYNKIKAFWLIYEPPHTKTLYIRVIGDLALDIPIELNDQNPAEIREFLISKVPELEGKEQSLSDMFLKIFKI